MEKTDLRKLYKNYYSATSEPVIISLPPANYICITGSGLPGDELFQQQTAALYQLAYGIKKKMKLLAADFTVPRLEALWWKDDNNRHVYTDGILNWQLMIRMPITVIEEIINETKLEIQKKKGAEPVSAISFASVPAGQFAQMLHLGSYKDEQASIDRLFQYIADTGLKVKGKHHEIYLSDPRKTDESQLKTIIRYQV